MDIFLIIQIFQLSSTYLSLTDSLKLLSLNSTFYKHLPNTYFKRNISISILRRIFRSNSSEETLNKSIESLLSIPCYSYDILYQILLPASNLIKNSRFLPSFSCWKIDYDTLSSRPWYSLKQLVPLPCFPNRLLISKFTIYHKPHIHCTSELHLHHPSSSPLIYKFTTIRKATYNSEISRCTFKQFIPDEVTSITCILEVIGAHYFSDSSVYFDNIELRIFRYP